MAAYMFLHRYSKSPSVNCHVWTQTIDVLFSYHSEIIFDSSSPPGAGRYASAPVPPVDRVSGGILAAGCTSAWSTVPLYILLSVHFLAGEETWWEMRNMDDLQKLLSDKLWVTSHPDLQFTQGFNKGCALHHLYSIQFISLPINNLVIKMSKWKLQSNLFSLRKEWISVFHSSSGETPTPNTC